MNLKLKFFLPILIITNIAFSQERKITGRVLDVGTQKPIKNVNISVLGSTITTYSNQLGFFELVINTQLHKTLVASHIGFKSSEVFIPDDDRFKFFLKREYIVLNEINLAEYPKEITEQFKKDNSHTENLTAIESDAIFPSGINMFFDLIGNSLSADILPSAPKPFDIVFTINENGQAVEISTSDSISSTTQAVIKAFQKTPSWIPATQRQGKVSQHFLLPIVFESIPDDRSLELDDLYKFIYSKIKYPAQALKMGAEGQLIAEFEIDKDGKIIKIEILKDVGADTGFEVKKVLSNMPLALSKSLVEKSKFNKFAIPFCFFLDESCANGQLILKSDVLLLNQVDVTAYGKVREVRAMSYTTRGIQKLPPVFTTNTLTDHTYTVLEFALEEPKIVKRLSLIGNNLSFFPKEIFKLSNLKYLDLEKNQLEEFPLANDQLTDLEELYLANNKLWSLTSNFVNLKKLKILGLSNNQFKEFPLHLVSLDKLEVLDLSENQIAFLPNEIGKMKNLKALMLQNNEISTLPKGIYDLKKLEKIFLNGNPISEKDIKLLKSVFTKAEIVF
jgi:hypothetical protein